MSIDKLSEDETGGIGLGGASVSLDPMQEGPEVFALWEQIRRRDAGAAFFQITLSFFADRLGGILRFRSLLRLSILNY